MNFGEKCRKYRTEKKMTQEEVARAAGISKRTYIYYETGNKYPRKIETAKKLASIFGTNVNSLLITDEEYLSEPQEIKPEQNDKEKLTEMLEHFFHDENIDIESKKQIYQAVSELYTELSVRNDTIPE